MARATISELNSCTWVAYIIGDKLKSFLGPEHP